MFKARFKLYINTPTGMYSRSYARYVGNFPLDKVEVIGQFKGSLVLNSTGLQWLFARHHLLEDENDTVVIIGDEVNVTKSGKKTYGIGRFFSSLYGKAVPSLYFLNLTLLSVKNRRSSSIMMEHARGDEKIFKG